MPDSYHSALEATAPVHITDTGSAFDSTINPESGIALCLSGGGYRAMLFHLGALWRLNEWGYLRKLTRISSVSGGSITAAVLGFKWSKLAFDERGVAQAFQAEVVQPVRGLAGKTIDEGSIVGGIFLPGSIADKVTNACRKHLFGNATLQDLPPDPPRFVINATNVQSGALWRFSRPYTADYRVGMIRNPTIELAVAVAASSAFPPVLSPLRMELDIESYEPASRQRSQDLHREPYLTERRPDRWRRLRQLGPGDGLETLPDDPREQRRREDAAGARLQGRLGAPRVAVNDVIDNQVRSSAFVNSSADLNSTSGRARTGESA